MIEKIQKNRNNYYIDMFFYHRAREAMFDAISQLYDCGYKEIFIPGYIGWSPKEGSGIFDPLGNIIGLQRNYYRMSRNLEILVDELREELSDNSILLIVNYFGFRDKKIDEVIRFAKEKNCIIVEDNAHGFYTYFLNSQKDADITFFSLHKMFPFEEGGSLLINNQELGIRPLRNIIDFSTFNPFRYDISAIANRRIENYKKLMSFMVGNEDLFIPLKGLEDVVGNVPQTFPIVIRKGDRNIIYELMNEQGFGVVSLYHTMINELREEKHTEAMWLSKRILNLPVHQDCDGTQYMRMIQLLVESCKKSYKNAKHQ